MVIGSTVSVGSVIGELLWKELRSGRTSEVCVVTWLAIQPSLLVGPSTVIGADLNAVVLEDDIESSAAVVVGARQDQTALNNRGSGSQGGEESGGKLHIDN